MKIRELYTDESKWTQDSYARNAEDESVLWDNPEAVCWCLMGAVGFCYPSSLDRVEVFSKIREKIGVEIPYWNDRASFKEVKQLVEELDI